MGGFLKLTTTWMSLHLPPPGTILLTFPSSTFIFHSIIIFTTLKPDIVIVDRKSNNLEIFELTVPSESRISIAHNLKLEKYQHFSSDITRYKVSVNPFEVGSHTGYISRDNKQVLARLHKFCKGDIKFKCFRNNVSAIAVLGSYFVFNSRNIETWHTPSEFIYAPMINMWIMYQHNIYTHRKETSTCLQEDLCALHVNLLLRIQYFFIKL